MGPTAPATNLKKEKRKNKEHRGNSGEPSSCELEFPNCRKTLIEADLMEEVEAVEEGLRSRRKLVQSTLFPNSAKQIPVKGGAEERRVDEEEENEEEEWCASQENGNKTKGKQRKKRNPKETTPQTQSRASKKVKFVASLLLRILIKLILLELHLIRPM